jgi:hypothetical protein
MDERGSKKVQFPAVEEIFLSSTASRPVLRFMKPTTDDLVMRIICTAIPPLLHASSWHGASLIKHSDNCTFTFGDNKRIVLKISTRL